MYDAAPTNVSSRWLNEVWVLVFPPTAFGDMGRVLIQLIIFKRETDMRYILILSILAASLGGCVLVPGGYDDNRGGYYHDHGHGDGNFRAGDDRAHGS
jgi:hypothetical protein